MDFSAGEPLLARVKVVSPVRLTCSPALLFGQKP